MSAEMPHSDEAVTKATGKNWNEWKSVVNEWGGTDKSHTEIARYLVDEHGLDGWWAQGVTVGYERLIGRRAVGQSNDGTFSASVSKTINAGAQDVFDALVDEKKRSGWLEDGVVTFRTGSEPKSARFNDLETGVIIAFFLTAKGESKTSLQVEASKLNSKEAGDDWKAAWKPRLTTLAEHLNQEQSLSR